MVALKFAVAFLVCYLGVILAAPAPKPTFFGGGKNEHFVIHVPYKVHTVHHHHIEKVPIYKEIPIVKHVPIYKEVHVPILKEVHVPVPVHHHDHHDYHSAGWW